MGKSDEEVIQLFHEQVNMSTNELEMWLASPESKGAGTGVGLESGKRILQILTNNPHRDPKQYTEDDMQHIRKVVGYIGRHLAQEGHLQETKTTDELEKTKSTISLKNWGHDPVKVKTQGKADGNSENGSDEGVEDADTNIEGSDADGEGETDEEAKDSAYESEDEEKSSKEEDVEPNDQAGQKRKRSTRSPTRDVADGQPVEKMSKRTRNTTVSETKANE